MGCLLGGGDEGETGKVGAVAAAVTGEKRVAGGGGVGADEEIGERGGSGATAAAVGEEGFAREEGGVFGNGFAVQKVAREGGFEGFDDGEPDGDFGVGDGVDDEGAMG
jgi:hypothetical protein